MSTTAKANRGPSAGPENRRALIEAARAVFSETGIDAPLSAIAKRAGVGQGSLYRHFPDRGSLALAVFGDAILELEACAARPDSGVAEVLDLVAAQMLVSVALIQLTLNDAGGEGIGAQDTAVRDRMLAMLESVLRRDRAAGRVAREISAEDVLLLLSMLAGLLPRTPAAERRATVQRSLQLFWRSLAP